MPTRKKILSRRNVAAFWAFAIGLLSGFLALHSADVETRLRKKGDSFLRGAVGDFDTGIYDRLFSIRGPEPQRPNIPEVVIVQINAPAIANVAEVHHADYPFPRRLHAQVLRNLKRAGAKVIGMDIVFGNPAPAGREADDRELAAAIRECGNVVLAADFTPSRSEEADTLVSGEGIPIEEFRAGAAAIAPVNVPTRENHVRNFVLSRSRPALDDVTRDQEFACFGTSIAALYRGISTAALGEQLRRGEFDGYRLHRAPAGMTDSENSEEVRICFAGYPFECCRYVQYDQVLDGTFPAEAFRNKIVLIGDTTAETKDIFPTPMQQENVDQNRPGVEVQANIIHTLLARHDIGTFPNRWRVVIVWLLALAVALIVLRYGPLYGAGWVLLLLTAIYAAVVGLFLHRIFLMPTQMLGAVGFSYVFETLYFFTVERRRVQEIRKRFGGYVGPKVLAKVADEEYQPGARGEDRYLTVLFSDIKGFTPFSEKMQANEIVSFLNEYCTQMVEIIFKHDGTLDKFIGDGIMAYFNAPEPVPNHEQRAVECGIAMQRAVRAWSDERERDGLPRIAIRIGIHTGEVVIGDIGSESQRSYTVIGDTVNTASRMESLGKEVGADFLISESVQSKLPDTIVTEMVGEVAIRGREEKIRAYRVLHRSEN